MSRRTEPMSVATIPSGVRAALDGLRVDAVGLLHESYAPGWSARIPDRGGLAALLGGASGDCVIAFHAVLRGACTLELAPGRGASLAAGDLALVASGAAHGLRCGGDNPPVSLADLLQARTVSGSPTVPPSPRSGSAATLCCGAIVLRGAAIPLVLRSLPEVVHLRAQSSPSIAAVVAALAEPGPHALVARERLLEYLCANAISAALATTPMDARQFDAMRDRVLGPVLEALQREPDRAWTLQGLARLAHSSPSRLSERFRVRLGTTPARFLTRLRLDRARELLSGSDLGIEAIAGMVGYASAASLSKALMRELHLRPGAVRLQRNGPGCARPAVDRGSVSMAASGSR